LRVAFSVCEEVAVMYAGTVLEFGDARMVEAEPRHPYTLGLFLSEPAIDRRLPDLAPIKGTPAKPDDVLGKCVFEPRCTWAREECRQQRPTLQPVGAQRAARLRATEIRHGLRAVRP